MAATVYVVEVQVGLRDMLTGPLAAAGRSVDRIGQGADQASKNLNRVGAAADGAGRNIQRLGQFWTAVFVSREFIRLGEATFGMFAAMVSGAGELEAALTRVQIAAGLSAGQMDTMHSAALRIQQAHLMSTADAADMVGVMARSGIRDPKALEGLLGPVSDFADVMQFTRGMDFKASAELGVRFAQATGANTPENLTRAMDELFRGSQFTASGDPSKLFTIFGGLHGVAGMSGIPLRQQMQLAAEFENIGLDKRGATEFSSGLLHALVSKKGHGFIVEKDGQVDLLASLAKMSGFTQAHPLDATAKAMHDQLGTVGLRALGVLAQPEHIAALKKMMALWDDASDIQQAHSKIMRAEEAEVTQLKSNFKSLRDEIGGAAWKDLRGTVQDAADALGRFTNYLDTHPRAKELAAHATEDAAGGIIGGAAIGAIAAPIALTVGLPVIATAGAAFLTGTVTSAIVADIIRRHEASIHPGSDVPAVPITSKNEKTGTVDIHTPGAPPTDDRSTTAHEDLTHAGHKILAAARKLAQQPTPRDASRAALRGTGVRLGPLPTMTPNAGPGIGQ